MKFLYGILVFVVVASLGARVFSYFDKKTVNQKYLTRYEGKWASEKEQMFFAKTANGFSVSLYRSPEATMRMENNMILVKNLDSFEYVENAGGQMNYRDGGFYFDFYVSPTEKLPFRFKEKSPNQLLFTCENEKGNYEMHLLTIQDRCILEVEHNGVFCFRFSGVKMRY